MSEVVSKSLLVTQPRIPLSEEESRKFCLGLIGWCPCVDYSPPSESSSLDSLEMDRQKQCASKPLKLKRVRNKNHEEVEAEPPDKVSKCDERFFLMLVLMS